MADLRFSSRRRNNYAGSGHRIYANSNGFQAEMQAQEWPIASEGCPRKDTVEGQEEQMRRPWNENKRLGTQKHNDVLQEVGIKIGSKHATGNGPALQDQEEDIRNAATLLLARAGGILFADLCESCSAKLQSRLAAIVSGEGLSALSTESCTTLVTELPASSDRISGHSNGSSATEVKLLIPDSHGSLVADASLSENGTDDYGADKNAVVESKIVEENAGRHEVVVKKDDQQAQASRLRPNDERRMGNVVAGSNDAANLIIKSALRGIHNAPAYKTRSVSRQAGLLQIPDQNFEPATNNREHARLLEVGRKKDFCLFEQVNGQNVNILEGLELHTNVFDIAEQKELIEFVYELRELGRNQKLRKRTYSEPRKWMRGKGRVTIQFGCCYNYAVDKDGNPPGIIREEEVDEIPPKLRMVIQRLVQWQVLPSSCIPDSCIVNIYDVGDCIPPHIDHHDFVRPFCTLSLLSECNIIFGTNLKIVGPGEFKGSISVPLPTGSVLILNGNGADVAKHAVPAVPTPRISITFRKMDPTKVPYNFKPDKVLLSTQPLMNGRLSKSRTPALLPNPANDSHLKSRTSESSRFSLDSDFPALGRPVPDGRQRNLRS